MTPKLICFLGQELLTWLLNMREASLQQIGQLSRCSKSPRRVFRVQLADDPFQPCGHVGIDRADGYWLHVANLANDCDAAFTAEWSPAGAHGVKRATQSE